MLGHRDRRDGSSRRGSGEIQITSVELFVGDGAQPVKRFRTGDHVRIRMTLPGRQAGAEAGRGIRDRSLGRVDRDVTVHRATSA